ncbi:MAG: efflux RND transporter periplasmic adaptor subunit [Bacteroidales bacterium]|nr:efflux RND transporter periplasmic adaptor subunit [Bacteroidales bacterium]
MEKSKKYIAIAFVVVLVIVVIISTIGILSLGKQPELMQGQIEATEIRISGKILGRVNRFLVEEGQNVEKGDTLVVINSPEVMAQYNHVNALGDVAIYENQKVEEGTRKEIVEAARQGWNKTKSDLDLAEITYRRIQSLYRDSVITEQRRDETEALYKATQAAERAAFQVYQLAMEGASVQDRKSSQSLVRAARSTAEEIEFLLEDTRLVAPESGQIAVIYPKRGELVAPGTPIMSLIVLEEAYVILNVREDLMPRFKIGGRFVGNVPAINRQEIEFEVYYISPLGSYATWKSTKQAGSYDMRTFEIKARPVDNVAGLRPGMSVLVNVGL